MDASSKAESDNLLLPILAHPTCQSEATSSAVLARGDLIFIGLPHDTLLNLSVTHHARVLNERQWQASFGKVSRAVIRITKSV
jgi:hypothetical protein